ncbi:hypothetical protein PENTCL1PPCAC_18195, partial [Pristionchus entomophagus]
SRQGSLSRSKPMRASSSTYITFTPETVITFRCCYRQSKDVEVNDNGLSSIMFKMKSTSAEYYHIRPVFFLLRPKEKLTIKVTFKGLPSDVALCQRDRITAVMAFCLSDSKDVKMLWEKHRRIAHQPNTSSRKYLKINFEDERRMSVSPLKTNISLLTSAYRSPSDDVPPPPSLPRPSCKVANSGGRDASMTHPNSTKKEQAIRPPSIHPSDLHPSSSLPPPLERLEPSLRTSIPLPPSQSIHRPPPPPPLLPPNEETNEDEEYPVLPPPHTPNHPPVKSKTLPVKTRPSSIDDSKKSKIIPMKTPSTRKPPVVSPSQEKSSIEDEDIPSTTPSGRTAVTDEQSTQQQSIVYILYPGEEGNCKEDENDKEKDEDS